MPKFEDEAKPPFNINDIERSFYYETEAIPKTNRSSSKNRRFAKHNWPIVPFCQKCRGFNPRADAINCRKLEKRCRKSP